MFTFIPCLLIMCFGHTVSAFCFKSDKFRAYEAKYGHFSEEDRLKTLQDVKEMFYFGYDNYMKHAYPMDELNPIYCSGRGHDYDNPSNLNVNDVLGDYSLTLVDTLDTLAVMGNTSEFKRAVQLVIDNLSFDKPSTVQVFEATIRVIGGLLSAHLIITDPDEPFGDVKPPDYSDELLHLSHDLAARLIPAFQNTATGLPYPRVNLRDGVLPSCINETCTSGAGTLVVEFSILSRLLHDPIYESLARRAVRTLWKYRSNVTGLLGNVINIQTGEWVGQMSGLGAGLDSFYEYLLKSFVLFGDPEDLKMFNDSYETIRYNMRRGRLKCDEGSGYPPLYVNVHMKTGDTANHWIDALQAAWSGVQVLAGDIDEAVCSHAWYYSIWRKYQSLPERYNWNLHTPDVTFYPLRPELVESTYLLYQATQNPFYLHVGRDIYHSINSHAKAECGYGTIHDVNTKELEDRMESFFLSETCKYLFLLFDRDNHVNRKSANYIFSTEGHLFPVNQILRQRSWEADMPVDQVHDDKLLRSLQNSSVSNCERVSVKQRYFLPLDGHYLEQLDGVIGTDPLS